MAPPDRLPTLIRVVVAAVGLAVGGPALVVLALGVSWPRLAADDLYAVAVLLPFAVAGVFFLAISIAGRSPRWLPLYERGVPRAAGRGLFLGLALVAALGVSRALESWLPSRLGLGPRTSWWLSLVPLVVAYRVYASWTKKRLGDAPRSRPAA
jgi:hypothetical protein